MLEVERVVLNIDNDNIELSPLLIRNVRGKDEVGSLVYMPELQCKVKNTGQNKYYGFEVELNYYDENHVFIGFDHDRFFGKFDFDKEVSISLNVEPPKAMVSAELVVELDRPDQTEELLAESKAMDERREAERKRIVSVFGPLPKNLFQAVMFSPVFLWIVIVILLIVMW